MSDQPLIINLELEQMRYSVKAALAQRMASMDKMLQDAIDEACSSENLEKIIKETAYKEMNQVVANCVKSWFYYTAPGRKIIENAVHERMTEIYGEPEKKEK